MPLLGILQKILRQQGALIRLQSQSPRLLALPASLVVRAPLNQGAVDDNKEAFASQNTAKFQKLTDTAMLLFGIVMLVSFNILKHNTGIV